MSGVFEEETPFFCKNDTKGSLRIALIEKEVKLCCL